MRKRALLLLLCAALCVALLPPGPARAADRLSFISIDDLLPPELVNCVYNNNGMTYVPYYVFTNYGLGISYTYFTSAATAYVYTKDRQLFFELNSGETYDENDVHYSAPGVLMGGVVYLPLSTIYRVFGGFTYTNLAGNEYGSVLRIKTGAAVLSDTDFLRAARSAMRARYIAYNSEEAGQPATLPGATEQPDDTHAGEQVELSFTGLPTDRVLTLLGQYRLRACFFLTAEDLRSGTDPVRRAVGEGHAVGIYCSGDDLYAEYRETAALLYEVSRTNTILVASPRGTAEACRVMAEEEGLCFRPADFGDEADGFTVTAYTVTAWLEKAGPHASLRINCAAGQGSLAAILQYLNQQKYDVVCPRETDAF